MNRPQSPWEKHSEKARGNVPPKNSGEEKKNEKASGSNSGNGSGNSSSNGNPWQNQQNAKKTSDDLDDILRKIENLVKRNLGGNGGNNSKNNFSGSGRKTPKSLAGLIILGAILLWLASGFYKVDADENAVVLYFGKFYALTTPGLNYCIPYPFGQVIKKSVTTVNNEEFGFASNNRKYESRNFDAESLMLTGDENIVDIEFQVQWQIADIKNFIFNIAEPNLTIRKTAESAMREIIARTPIASALSDGKKKIEIETKDLLQEVLDSYGAGVRITLVQLRRVDPPKQVIDAFRDVQTAKADKEKEINQAQSYSNNIIPRSRGDAAQILQEAEAYKKQVVATAEGEAGRFLSVYKQYSSSKQVTKKRIYLETMEKIYRDMDKIMIDKKAAGVIPYFPLNEMKEKK